MKTNCIELSDGSRLECYTMNVAKDMATAMPEASLLGMRIWAKSKRNRSCDCDKDAYARIFRENAYLFFDNAAKILSDSRLFLIPIDEDNSMDMGITNITPQATLGAYVEWWLYQNDLSTDPEGRLIWQVCDSLDAGSGSRVCWAIDRDGQEYDTPLEDGGHQVWQSFADVCNRYSDAVGKYQAYDLEYAVILLKELMSDDDMAKHRYRMEIARNRSRVYSITSQENAARKQLLESRNKFKQFLFDTHREAVGEYYAKCVNLQAAAVLAREYLHNQRAEMRLQLRENSITRKEYAVKETELRRRAQEAEDRCLQFKHDGLKQIFGIEDYRLMSFGLIERLLIGAKCSENE